MPTPYRTFGPAAIDREGAPRRAVCTWCVFRIYLTCTYVKPSRALPGGAPDTPDWCEMKAAMLRDAGEMAAEAAKTKP